jgi:hypothetical protein
MAIDFVAFRITLSMFHNSKRIYSNITLLLSITFEVIFTKIINIII